jgi:hypothetical protein
LQAIDLESGSTIWTLDVAGGVPTLVDAGVVLATYRPDDDSTELKYFG